MIDANVVSYIIVHDKDIEAQSAIKSFCQKNKLIDIKGSRSNFIDLLGKNINLGAIFISENPDDGGEGVELGQSIHLLRPEVPIFLRTLNAQNAANISEESRSAFAGIYQLDNIMELQKYIDRYIFSDDYPNHLIRTIQTHTIEAIESQLVGFSVSTESPCIVNDRLIYGDLHSAIPLESNWCKGHMMVQVDQDDLGLLLKKGRTVLGFMGHVEFRDINTWLAETTNLIWGSLKSRLLSAVKSDGPISDVQLPVITNQREKYISFGTERPHLSIKYILTDTSGELENVHMYQKLIFNITWAPELATEEQIVLEKEEDVIFF